MQVFNDITNKNRTSGIIYWATNYTIDTDNIPTIDSGATPSAIKTYIEGTYTFQQIAYYDSFVNSTTQEDENITNYDDCNKSESRTSRPVASFNFNLFGTSDYELIQKVLDTEYEVIPGTPVVGQPQLFAINTPYGTFQKIANQNADGTQQANIALTEQNTAYSLVLGTDYFVIQDGSGAWGIQFVNSGNYDLTTNAVDMTYDYTPGQAECVAYESVQKELPRNLFKFVSCGASYDDAGVKKTIKKTHYLSKAQLTSQYDIAFAVNGSEQSTAVTLTGAKNSVNVLLKENV